ncbi:MAG: ribonuclease H-like domain-containing protein [Patescibacteria group bacterium]
MAKLVFDIETIGEDFDSLDKITRDSLTRWLKKESESEEEYKIALEELKAGLGFSPLTGSIAAIGVLDVERNLGAVYYQNPGKPDKDFEEGGITLRAMGEKEMLEKFWEGAVKYQQFISFNGRAFDAPFLLVRSAVHGIKPTVNLMPYRYANDTTHLDLLDQLTFYGSVRKKGNLHLWSRVFGIKSPKTEGITGEDVGQLFKEGKYLDIARYNVGDLRATRELYLIWERYIRF